MHATPLYDAKWLAADGPRYGVTGETVTALNVEYVSKDLHYAADQCPARQFIVLPGSTMQEVRNIDFTVEDNHGLQTSGILCGSGTSRGGHYAGIAPAAQLLSYMDLDFTSHSMNTSRRFQETFAPRIYTISADAPPSIYMVMNDQSTDVAVTWSAGNAGDASEGGAKETTWPSWKEVWSQDGRVLLVGATTWDGSAVAGYSSRGKIGEPRTYPTLTAPGCMFAPQPPPDKAQQATLGLYGTLHLVETGACPPVMADVQRMADLYKESQYGIFAGTSAAAPVVAGVLAMMFQVNPDLDARTAVYLATRTANPFLPAEDTDGDGKVSPEEFFDQHGWQAGYGLVNATGAVAASHYLALHPDATREEAVACFTTTYDEGHLVLNPWDGCAKPVVSAVEGTISGEPDPAAPEGQSAPLPVWLLLVGLAAAVRRRRRTA